MFFPSNKTCPTDGLINLESARSKVDFPHAFGPTITVNDCCGIFTDKFWKMVRSPYWIIIYSARSRESNWEIDAWLWMSAVVVIINFNLFQSEYRLTGNVNWKNAYNMLLPYFVD